MIETTLATRGLNKFMILNTAALPDSINLSSGSQRHKQGTAKANANKGKHA